MAQDSTQCELPLASPDRSLGHALPLALIVYAVLFLLGVVVFQSGVGGSGQGLSFPRAVFLSADLLSLGGFQTSVNISADNRMGRAVMLLLMFGGAYLALTVGGLAVVRIARLPYGDRYIALSSLISLLLAMLAGAALLGRPGEDALLDSAAQGLGAFANAGAVFVDPPELMDWRLHAVILPLAIAGGLGMPVLLECFDRLFSKHCLSRHAQIVLLCSAGLYLGGLVLLLLFTATFSMSKPVWTTTQIVSAHVAAINSRSLGLPIEYAYTWPRTTQWIVIGLMLVGGASGSCAGGLKCNTLGHLLGGAWSQWRVRGAGRFLGWAVFWTTGYLLAALLSTLLLMWSEPQIPADRVCFLAVSALGTVGLSHDLVSVSTTGYFTLSSTLFLGRLLPLLLLWHLVSVTDEQEVIG